MPSTCAYCGHWDRPDEHLSLESGEAVAFCLRRPLSASVKLAPAIASSNFSQLGTRAGFSCEYWQASKDSK